MTKISLNEARNLILSAQGLGARPAFSSGKLGAVKAVEHLGYVQIDTISVVERAHHHVFWSRVPDYNPAMLDQMLSQDKSIFEYWSHAAAYLPMRDFRFSLVRKARYLNGKNHWHEMTPELKKVRRQVLARIRAEGPLAARDFEAPAGFKSGWFNHKPAKIALEQLFMEGLLMTSGRQGFQKLYDLTENVLPSGVDTRFPSPAEMNRHLIQAALRAHGIARPEEISYMRRKEMMANIRNETKKMLVSGELEEIRVHGIDKPYLIFSSEKENLLKAAQEKSARTLILSPFDNHIIQRKRLKELFGFDYLIECYVPEPKRIYGYFSLPVLQGSKFVGRLNAKADRAEKELLIRSFHPEKKASLATPKYNSALKKFAQFNGCEKVAASFTTQS